MSDASDLTYLLLRWSDGDQDALDELFPLVYGELKALAHARLRNERRGSTLNTTGLVHEAYLKLLDIDRLQWKGHNHFLAMASRVMRRVLVDHAHKRRTQKRGGGVPNKELDEGLLLIPESQTEEFLALDEALNRLESEHPRVGKAVELHYFGGLTQVEVGQVLGVSQPTAMRDLRFARAWLSKELNVDYGS